MRLREYLDSRPRGEATRLVRKAEVAASTIYDHLNGKPIKVYACAKKIAEATGGLVTIEELCNVARKSSRPRKRAA